VSTNTRTPTEGPPSSCEAPRSQEAIEGTAASSIPITTTYRRRPTPVFDQRKSPASRGFHMGGTGLEPVSPSCRSRRALSRLTPLVANSGFLQMSRDLQAPRIATVRHLSFPYPFRTLARVSLARKDARADGRYVAWLPGSCLGRGGPGATAVGGSENPELTRR
jgi:hypothetical protein